MNIADPPPDLFADPSKVRCCDCTHMFHDGFNKRNLLPDMFSCRPKQRTPEERATYVSPVYLRKCDCFAALKANQSPLYPLPAQVDLFVAPVAATPPPAPVPKPEPVVRSNSPHDLGARRIPPAVEYDPFDCDAPTIIKKKVVAPPEHDPFDIDAIAA